MTTPCNTVEHPAVVCQKNVPLVGFCSHVLSAISSKIAQVAQYRARRLKIWKSKEVVHDHPPKDPLIGLPARCALIHCSRQTRRLARLAPVSCLNPALEQHGTRIPSARP